MNDTTDRTQDGEEEMAEQSAEQPAVNDGSEEAGGAAADPEPGADEAHGAHEAGDAAEAADQDVADSGGETSSENGSAGEKEPEAGLWPVERLKPVLEAVLFAAADAMQIRRVCQIIDGATRPEVAQALEQLRKDCEERGFRLVEVAGGWQFRTAPEHHETVRKLFKEKPQRLTRAQMEVLTIIVYKQPATRAEVEVVRGVDSSSVMEALVERRIVRIAGRRDVAGRPLVYVTTQEFLELFGLKDLRALPALPELGDDIETMAERSGFTDPDGDRDAAVLPLEEGDTGEEVQGQSNAAQADGEAGSQDHEDGEGREDGAREERSNGDQDGDRESDEVFDGPPLEVTGREVEDGETGQAEDTGDEEGAGNDEGGDGDERQGRGD